MRNRKRWIGGPLDFHPWKYSGGRPWLVTIRRWMDGSLLDLTAEMVESELEDYWHELFKVQKLLVTKLRKARTDISAIRQRSNAELLPSAERLNSSMNILFLGTRNCLERASPK